MAKIFISYRRQDSAGVTGRIYDRLVARFGEGAVFMDVDSIPYGEDFRKHIDSAVGLCDVVLAVIGTKWAGEADGRRRIDDPRDPVRIEIESALKREILVIPILIDHARIPGEEDLPPSLTELAFRNAADVDQGRDFHPHVGRLIKSLEYHFQKASHDTAKPPLGTATTAASRSPVTGETDPPGMWSGPVEQEPSPTPADPQDDLSTEVLTGLLFPVEEEALDQTPPDDPIMARTVESGPRPPELRYIAAGKHLVTLSPEPPAHENLSGVSPILANQRDEPPILGIDLGTSTCVACVMQGDSPLFIRPDLAYDQEKPHKLKYPGHLMPSAFCNRDGEELTGYRALEQLADPKYVHDVVLDIQSHMKWDGHETFASGGQEYPPSRIAGVHLRRLLQAAERQLNLPAHTIEKAVVTVPAAFGSAELGATRRACGQAGLLEDHIWLVDEPVAAAYSLGLHRQPGGRLVLVIDLGGETFDATLLRVGQDVSEDGFLELGRGGDANLGGRKWDYELAFCVAHKTLGDDAEVRRWLEGEGEYRTKRNHLFLICEKAKIDFFSRVEANRDLILPVSFRSDPNNRTSRTYTTEVSARLFLQRTEPLVEQCVLVCLRLLDDVSRISGQAVDWADLDCIYMVGGGSKMWTVQDRFAELWGRQPIVDKEPEFAIARGAALMAQAVRDGRKPRLIGRRRYPNGIGILTRSSGDGPSSYMELVPRNQAIPFELEFRFPSVSRGNSASRISIPLVERRLTVDGPVDTPVKVLTLAVPPAAMRGPDEEIVLRVSCDNEECLLDYRIEFRGSALGGSLTQEELKESIARRPGLGIRP